MNQIESVCECRAQQLIEPERRGRVSHQAWCGEGCVKSRRPVNSDVRRHSVVKRCSSPGTLHVLGRKGGGTFGFVAMGIFHGPELPKNVDPKLPAPLRERLERTPLGYGHMNGWPNEFQVICIEKVELFSGDGSVFEYQKPDVRKRILAWYAKDHSP